MLSVSKENLSRLDLERIARRALDGVGNAKMGEWVEYTGKAFHLRRRLRPTEEMIIGPAVDVRGTPEAMTRLDAMRGVIPPSHLAWAMDEIGTVCIV